MSLEPGQEGLALVQNRLHVVEDGHEVCALQGAQVHVGAGHGVQEVWETALLGHVHTDRHHVLACRQDDARLGRKNHFLAVIKGNYYPLNIYKTN